MANILSVTCGMQSVVYPSVELARRLAVAGHQVTFAGLPESRALVEHQGLRFLALEASRYPQFLAEDSRSGLVQRILNLSPRRRQAKDAMAVEKFARDVAEMGPDLILIDGEMHEHILAASGSGVPLVLLNSFSSIWRRPGLPPPHHFVQPGVGWRGTSVGMAFLWFALRLRKWRRAASLKVRRVGCDRLSILRLLARDAGFNFRRETDDSQWLVPFTYRHLPVLSLHALEFEFPHDPPRKVHYVGPQLLTSRIDHPFAPEERAALDTIFSRRRREEGERRLIYAGFGSVFSTDLAFLKRLLQIVEGRPHWELVISLSGSVEEADLGPLPEGVHAFAWVPQLEVIQQADVVITHGGINTIDECVLHGVPMLVYCGFETDMGGNTARVVHHGIGLAGDRQRDPTLIIRRHIERLLEEPGFKTNLGRMQRHYAAYAENHVAEQTVESLLDRKANAPST